MPDLNFNQEFNRQVEILLKKGYPSVAGLTETEFLKHVERLRNLENKLDKLTLKQDYLPFVIVLQNDLVKPEMAIELVERQEQKGFSIFETGELDAYTPLDSLKIPPSSAYLLVGIDRGSSTLNVAPNQALIEIQNQNRFPLTLNEGIAILTYYPEFLVKNNCFSLLGSRTDNKRVPALWISQNKPKLGWCWAGNPHTWLGSASCANRLGYD